MIADRPAAPSRRAGRTASTGTKQLNTHQAAGGPVLVATGIHKTFGRTRALAGADLEVRTGEVHGLLGANGAGKSTLSKAICGHISCDSGEFVYRNEPLKLRNTRDALNAGIAIVMQETSLAPDLTVLENIFLPELGRPGRLNRARQRSAASDILSRLGHEHALPLDREVRLLSAAQRQLVEIAKALAVDADLIIFDEPTASLSPSEVERLFDVMSRLREDGHALMFVSHRLEEVFAITDRVSVMREGRTVLASRPTATLTQNEIIRAMVGQDIGQVHAAAPAQEARDEGDAPIVLSVENLSAPPAVRDISFSVRRGEILGLGGLVGAGRSEAVETIFGLRPRGSGRVTLNGTPFAPRKPSDAIRAGVGFVAEDRRTQNIVPDFSVKENLLLAHLGEHRGFGLDYRRREKRVEELLGLLGLPSERLLDSNMLNFSGGMQQKVIIARWLLLDPIVLILDEPTKGVDIGTRASIYQILKQIAATGTAVVVVSSDFEELLGLAERVIVISDGLSVADVPSARLNEEKLTLLAAPRTSMARNTQMLRRMTEECGGAAFWALVDGDEIICLNSVVADPEADPGFGTGDAKLAAETRIPEALGRLEQAFVAEKAGGRTTMLMQMTSGRGHDFGWIGLTLAGTGSPPAAETVRRHVETLSAVE